MTKVIAELDAGGRLVGTHVGEPAEGDVAFDELDLPTDGTYKWAPGPDGAYAFWPLGHGFERVATIPAVSRDLALYHMIRSRGAAAPKAARDWAKWYDENLRQRDEEQGRAQKIKAKR